MTQLIPVHMEPVELATNLFPIDKSILNTILKNGKQLKHWLTVFFLLFWKVKSDFIVYEVFLTTGITSNFTAKCFVQKFFF